MGHRFVGLIDLPRLLVGVIGVVLSVKIATTNLLFGLFMLSITGLTLVLAVRAMVANRGAAKRLESTGELTRPNFDYLVWIALGMPMLLVVALLILAITGALTSK
jgi:hypothetical protein